MSNKVWAWVGLSWTDRIRLVLDQHGDKITDISIFGWRVTSTGELIQTFDPSQLDPYRAKWPHIRFWGCFRNMDDPTDGPFAIFESLRNSAAYRANLANEVQTKMFDMYPWLHGVDIDMESGGNARSADSEEIFRVVTNRAHSSGREASGALPALTASGSVGGENWVRYAELGAILDHVAVMSYDFAWSGSAPGPVSPGFWLEAVYDWAASQIPPEKVSMGIPLYSYFWYLHDTPANRGQIRRGVSGTYYAMWQYFTGVRAWDDAGITHDPIGWIAYRDESSMSGWGYMNVYDWKESHDWESAQGVVAGTFQARDYVVRYGLPAGSPQWSVADNSVGAAEVNYRLAPELVYSASGDLVGPKVGYTLTAEFIQREPVAATIIDDYATSAQQLNTIYTKPSGAWSFAQVSDTYKQYRGTGELRYNHDFGAQSLYVLARFQFATAGRFGVTSQGITADVSNTGHLRVMRGSTVLAEKWVTARPVGSAPMEGRTVLTLRVREGSARVYYSTAETSIPLQLKVDTTPPGGPTGYTSTGQVWIDHTYLGDGWLYQPREAVEVTVGGQSKIMGRIARTGVTWDSFNRFRPDTDVDEPETRETAFSLDWVYSHWIDAPFVTGQTTEVKVRPLDHDLWLGRLTLGDRDGFSICYFTDATTVNHWRARASLDWGLQGIAMWSLGQEDVRMWDAFAGGLLAPQTKRLDG